MLGLKFAYATNGTDIIEIDYFTGTETRIASYPSPAELWERYRKGNNIAREETGERLLTPFMSNRVQLRPPFRVQ
jgi:type I restriction enzyme R subunit